MVPFHRSDLTADQKAVDTPPNTPGGGRQTIKLPGLPLLPQSKTAANGVTALAPHREKPALQCNHLTSMPFETAKRRAYGTGRNGHTWKTAVPLLAGVMAQNTPAKENHVRPTGNQQT